jgi:flagellar biogenesis protein FliO
MASYGLRTWLHWVIYGGFLLILLLIEPSESTAAVGGTISPSITHANIEQNSKMTSRPEPLLEDYFSTLLKVLLMLILVSLLAYIILKFGLRRFDHLSDRRGLIQILDRKPLGNRMSIYVVVVQNRALLIGATEKSIHVLTELDVTSLTPILERGEPPGSSRLREIASSWFSKGKGRKAQGDNRSEK